MTEEMIKQMQDIVNANYPINVPCDTLKKICQATLNLKQEYDLMAAANHQNERLKE